MSQMGHKEVKQVIEILIVLFSNIRRSDASRDVSFDAPEVDIDGE